MQKHEKEIIRSEQGDAQCIHVQHPSGLTIYIMEMEGYHSSFALFGTKYGSINTRFRLKGEENYTEVPEGIAHYLEHKLFENEDCDAFEQYAKTGAMGNAYTSFDRTAYLFACSENFNDSLRILLNFVQSPYFTKETVDKEQGIIAQEIRMNEDDAGWRVFFNMLKAMYHNHPVRIDIAGTVDSIKQINAELLYKCYHTFYNLHNMVLSVAGNIKADEVLAVCDELLKPCEDQGLEQLYADEPDDIVKSYVEDTLPVGKPIFNLGFKLKPQSGKELLRSELIATSVLDVLLGAGSPFYQKLLTEGLINSEFDTDSPFTGDGYFVLSCGGESEHPEEVRDRIIAEIEKAKKEGLDKEAFERSKRVHYGDIIRSLNSVEGNASMMLNAYIAGVKPFSTVEALATITYEDAQKFLCEEIDTTKAVLSVVHS